MTHDDRRYLEMAARAALRARGDAEPNPCVGAVIVVPHPNGGEGGNGGAGGVIGIGHHRRFGGPHAEREAIADCRRRGLGQLLPKSTLYVTLEPCAHHGKQPPCTDAVLEAGIPRVVCAARDPNPAAAGGAERLRAAGVDVRFCGGGPLVAKTTCAFVKRSASGLPWVIAKWAQTLDGRCATRTGESQWISNEFSRRRVHRLRARVDAILTGIGTVLRDDPTLTARGVPRVRRVARRVVVDPRLEIPLESNLVRSVGAAGAPLTIACTAGALAHEPAKARHLAQLGVEIVPGALGETEIDLRALLAHLATAHDASNVMTEAGPRLLGRLFAAGLVDEAHVYIAPTILGDGEARPAVEGLAVPALADAKRLRLVRAKPLAGDMVLEYLVV